MNSIYVCPWILRIPNPRPCGYVQRGPGKCPYDHAEEVELVRLVISEVRREQIREAALAAAFEANERREISYTAETLIQAAVEAAIDKAEEILA